MNGDAIHRRGDLVMLHGSILNYRCTRTTAHFVFNDSDRAKLAVVAIAAAAAGLSGQAASTAASATSLEEDADWLEFELNGQEVMGWLWRSPFKNGDEVKIAAQWTGAHYEILGMSRPDDHIIALYPHCSRGRVTHIRNAIKWWFIGVTLFLLFVAVICLIGSGYVVGMEMIAYGFPYAAPIAYAFFGLMTISLTRTWMPFARLTETVARTLELPNPASIDLVRSAKAQRQPTDPGEYGTFYFRY